MAFSTGGGSGPMADINVTPLVDVMLVLLIIFMITMPMLSHKIKIDLPQPTNTPNLNTPPEPIRLTVQAGGQLFWNGEPISEEALRAQLAVYGVKPIDQQPELDIRADKQTKYQLVATVMADAKNAGIGKIGFESGQ